MPKGVAAYQETPCAAKAKGGRIGYTAPLAPSKKLSWSAQRGTLQQQQAQRQRLYEAEAQTRAPGGGGPSSFQQDLAQANADSAAASARMGPKISRRDQSTDSAVPVPAPATEPTIIRDQYLNQYSQPPGSAFVTDQKTGQQCFKNGTFIHCK